LINILSAKIFDYSLMNSSPSTRSEIIYQNADSLSSSGIKDNTKTTMVIDGFLSDVTSPMSQTTKNGKTSEDVELNCEKISTDNIYPSFVL